MGERVGRKAGGRGWEGERVLGTNLPLPGPTLASSYDELALIQSSRITPEFIPNADEHSSAKKYKTSDVMATKCSCSVT